MRPDALLRLRVQGGATLFSRRGGSPAGFQALGPTWGEEGAADAHTCRPAMLPVGVHDSLSAAKVAPQKTRTPGC